MAHCSRGISEEMGSTYTGRKPMAGLAWVSYKCVKITRPWLCVTPGAFETGGKRVSVSKELVVPTAFSEVSQNPATWLVSPRKLVVLAPTAPVTAVLHFGPPAGLRPPPGRKQLSVLRSDWRRCPRSGGKIQFEVSWLLVKIGVYLP